MKLYLPLVLAGAALLTGCKGLNDDYQEKAEENDKQIQAYIASNGLSATKSPSGIYYQVGGTTSSRKPQVGEQVRYNFYLTQLNNQIIDSTFKTRLATGTWGLNFSGDNGALLEGLSMIGIGGSNIVLSPHSRAYGSQQYADSTGKVILPAYSAVRYDIKMVRVLNEAEQIEEYITSKQLKLTETTSEGLRYINITEGTGAQLTNGKSATVRYRGQLLNGTKFDESPTAGVTFTVGVSTTIPGFNQALQKMKVGGKAIVIMPSSLGYGTRGRLNEAQNAYTIQPYAPLLFELEILSAN
ncbi:hypothetical protein BWI93_14440 [Siphonobacter sp. BAB-5385]|uniref:FKBP-type peptidyl-prolyl cis-trans isomerase n=1 Tax=unclassified Siphonobacter TaxID=2635712 RepID=UPI000B9E90EA|nr:MULTISPECIES: FKBP-type peptidyl-prolyl cis-trans isomerase [unclassified Siphonobacter]OZI07531.1 hypothetical protein BWI93_14440 [Siphonobacter sp. BAB-5385]PMD98434.1 hypothetical protein BWI97_04540 [Siphonobacter sp. BAB-5405]